MVLLKLYVKMAPEIKELGALMIIEASHATWVPFYEHGLT